VVDEIDEESGECKPEGWSSSLFVNNPDIPAFAHRVVNPVSEPVFSSQKFKDLPIHPFMVSDALCYFLQCSPLERAAQMGTFLYIEVV
jgi:hypothetical protein